jgi:hypothetical protein
MERCLASASNADARQYLANEVSGKSRAANRGLHEPGNLGPANPSTCYGAKVGQPWGRCLLSLWPGTVPIFRYWIGQPLARSRARYHEAPPH